MAYILNLETATTNCSVALGKDGHVCAIREDNSPQYSHAENLHVFIKQVLEEAGIAITDINAVAVSKGPGSFTGLRIGVSAAKGLCYALGIPLISSSTLKTLAFQIKEAEGVIIPMLDARRQEVYTAVFDKNHSEIKAPWAHILEEKSFDEYCSHGPIHFPGNGALKARDILGSTKGNYHPELVPSAREMVGFTFEKYGSKDFEDPAYYEPYYLKDFMGKKL